VRRPLPSFGFEVGVEILADDRADCLHPVQRSESFCRIATALDNQCSQVLLSFCVCGFWNEEGDVVGVSFKGAPNALTGHGAN